MRSVLPLVQRQYLQSWQRVKVLRVVVAYLEVISNLRSSMHASCSGQGAHGARLGPSCCSESLGHSDDHELVLCILLLIDLLIE